MTSKLDLAGRGRVIFLLFVYSALNFTFQAAAQETNSSTAKPPTETSAAAICARADTEELKSRCKMIDSAKTAQHWETAEAIGYGTAATTCLLACRMPAVPWLVGACVGVGWAAKGLDVAGQIAVAVQTKEYTHLLVGLGSLVRTTL